MIQSDKMKVIEEKIENGERLTFDDGLCLYQSNDLLEIGRLANMFNQKLNGNKVYFIQNMSLYFTNICEEHCAFCHFRKDEGQKGAYTLTPQQMIEHVKKYYYHGLREFHIVGGHNPNVSFEYYIESIKALKKHYPHVTIKAYTAAEVDFFARISGLKYKEVLMALMEAGVETLTGGGAEILSDRYRKKMRVEKANTDLWLEVHRTAHNLGMKTHATMLYGAIESTEERLQHLMYIRELQDETNGFMVFVPNALQPASVNARIKTRVSAFENLKMIAISRLMLDNFQHIKAYFINLGTQLTQLALTFGASDAHGTIISEKISHSAGALSPDSLTLDELVWLIKGAGRIPTERDTFYNEVKVY